MIDVEIDIQGGEAKKELLAMEELLREEIPEAVAKQAEKGKRKIRSNLSRDDHVASGQGKRSVSVRKQKSGNSIVYGAQHLRPLYTGTDAHRPPADGRLIAWASQEGWRVSDIQDHIEEEGTEPAQKWLDDARESVKRNLERMTVKEVRKSIG